MWLTIPFFRPLQWGCSDVHLFGPHVEIITESMEMVVLADLDHQVYSSHGYQKRLAFFSWFASASEEELSCMNYNDMTFELSRPVERTSSVRFYYPFHSIEAIVLPARPNPSRFVYGPLVVLAQASP